MIIPVFVDVKCIYYAAELHVFVACNAVGHGGGR